MLLAIYFCALRWAVSLSNGDSPWSGDPNPSPRLSGRVSLDLVKPWRSHETGRDATAAAARCGVPHDGHVATCSSAPPRSTRRRGQTRRAALERGLKR